MCSRFMQRLPEEQRGFKPSPQINIQHKLLSEALNISPPGASKKKSKKCQNKRHNSESDFILL